jgi:hypothetical protein
VFLLDPLEVLLELLLVPLVLLEAEELFELRVRHSLTLFEVLALPVS